jgi:hypothetical protein
VLDQLTPGSTNFVVKAVLPNPTDQFHSGMVITGQVQRPVTSGISIPRTSFTDDTQTTVQTIVKKPDPQGGPPLGVIKTIPVTMVAEDTKNAIVQGVRPGQQIVINGQLGLSDGQPAEPATPGGGGRKRRTVAER